MFTGAPEEIHVCNPWTLTYHYVSRPGWPRGFCHRISCECGRYWTIRLVPSRDQEGKFVGLWSGTPKRKPDFEDRHRFRVLSSVPWNYYSEDFDPDKPPQELQSRPEPISSERSEELDEWRDWRRNGGFSHWP